MGYIKQWKGRAVKGKGLGECRKREVRRQKSENREGERTARKGKVNGNVSQGEKKDLDMEERDKKEVT